MSFGLKNTSVTFQRLMDTIFKWSEIPYVAAYVDEIIAFSQDQKQHQIHIEAPLVKLEDSGLRIYPSQCRFFHDKVTRWHLSRG